MILKPSIKRKLSLFNMTLVIGTYLAVCATVWHQSGVHWGIGAAMGCIAAMLLQMMHLATRSAVHGDVYAARTIISTACWIEVLLNIMTGLYTSLFSPATIVMTLFTVVCILKGLKYYRAMMRPRGMK